jgi:thiamine phosphate synthase YjbQ (UPF0047 family)
MLAEINAHAHLQMCWVENASPEAIRRAMLEVGRWKEDKLADFNRRLEVAQKVLRARSGNEV